MSWIHLIESDTREKDGGENVPGNACLSFSQVAAVEIHDAGSESWLWPLLAEQFLGLSVPDAIAALGTSRVVVNSKSYYRP